MDEEQEREKRYYGFLWKKTIALLILIGAMYILMLLMVWDPIRYGGVTTDGLFITFGLILVLVLLSKVTEKKTKTGFWTSLEARETIGRKTLFYLSIMISVTALIFSWIFATKFSLAVLVDYSIPLIIGVFSPAPLIYFIRKKRFQSFKKKYGRCRYTYANEKLDERKKTISDTLDRMKIKYTEMDESSKLMGPKKCFTLLESGMKIYYISNDLTENTILIANIPDDDTLEKQIEKEILRLLAFQS